MTDPIEEMKKLGWKLAEGRTTYPTETCEFVAFYREKPKPNAIVDFEALEKYLEDRFLPAHRPHLAPFIKKA